MKKIIILILLTVAVKTQSQVTFSSLILNAKKSELPYNSNAAQDENTMPRTLNDRQKQYVLNKLRSVEPLVLFSEKYPEMEPIESNNILDFGPADAILINTYIKWGNDFVLHLTLNQNEKKRGVLACVNSKGEWLSWIVSDINIWTNDDKGLMRTSDVNESGNINVNENYFDGKNEVHHHVLILLAGRTSDGKYIPFGKFHITTPTPR